MTSLSMYFDEVETLNSQTIPADVAMVMSAIEAGDFYKEEQRFRSRKSYRTLTQLRLFRDASSAPAREVFTRDINRRGLGFITRHRLPLGYGGTIVLPNEGGKSTSVHCTLTRCREAAPGWFEGSICFNREQPQFDL